MSTSTIEPTPEQIGVRFWPKVNKNGPIPVGTPAEGNCWDWTASRRGGKDKDYGQFRVRDGRTQEAHRVAWELENGPVPAGKVLGHVCQRSICVRPSHIAPMTRVEASHARATTRAKSGVRGVTWNSQAGKWKVSVSVAGKQAHGGYFAEDKKSLAERRAEELRAQLLSEASSR